MAADSRGGEEPALIDLLGQLSGWAIVGLVLANVFADQIGLPLPSAPALILAGALVARRYGWAAVLFGGSVAACLVAELVWYWAGRRYGGRVMRLLCILSLSPDSCVRDTQRRFDRWGTKALIVANFVPGLSVIAPPLAGAVRMTSRRFISLSLAGAALWAGGLLLAGMLLAREIRMWVPKLSVYGRPAAICVGVLLVAYVAFKWFERRRFLSMLRMARISVTELHRLMQGQPPPIVVDVRSASARVHDPRCIPGAVHVPVDDIESHVTLLARDREVILYCTCPNEASAAQVAKSLMTLGFNRVRPLLGGLDAWVDAGYPVDSVVAAGELERVTQAVGA